MQRYSAVLMLTLLLFNLNFLIPLVTTPVDAIVSEESFVLHHKMYPDYNTDSYIIMGEIINNLETSVSKVNLTVTFYDGEDRLLKKVYSSVFLEVVQPERRAAFKVGIEMGELASFEYYNVSILSYKTISTSKPVGFSIPSAHGTLYSNRTVVQGVVSNIASSQIKRFNIFALLYDKDGFVGVTDSDLTVPDLEAGAQDFFECTTWLINDTFDITTCIVTGETSDYSIEEEKTITSTKSGNQSPDYQIIAAVIVGVAALVVSLTVMWKRRKKLKKKKKSKK